MKKPNLGLMLDIETYGTTPNAVIRQICITPFSFEDFNVYIPHVFYPNIKEQLACGRTEEKSTKAWWNSEPMKKVHTNLCELEKMHSTSCALVSERIYSLVKKLKQHWTIYLFGRGATNFDYPIIENFLHQFGDNSLGIPYYRVVDLRSITTSVLLLTDTELVSHVAGKHDAETDCLEQIKQLERFKNILTISSLCDYSEKGIKTLY